MNIEIDPDLLSVAEFMQANIPADKLRATAGAIALLAPVIWGHYDGSRIVPVRLASSAILLDGQRRPQASTEHHLEH